MPSSGGASKSNLLPLQQSHLSVFGTALGRLQGNPSDPARAAQIRRKSRLSKQHLPIKHFHCPLAQLLGRSALPPAANRTTSDRCRLTGIADSSGQPFPRPVFERSFAGETDTPRSAVGASSSHHQQLITVGAKRNFLLLAPALLERSPTHAVRCCVADAEDPRRLLVIVCFNLLPGLPLPAELFPGKCVVDHAAIQKVISRNDVRPLSLAIDQGDGDLGRCQAMLAKIWPQRVNDRRAVLPVLDCQERRTALLQQKQAAPPQHHTQNAISLGVGIGQLKAFPSPCQQGSVSVGGTPSHGVRNSKMLACLQVEEGWLKSICGHRQRQRRSFRHRRAAAEQSWNRCRCLEELSSG